MAQGSCSAVSRGPAKVSDSTMSIFALILLLWHLCRIINQYWVIMNSLFNLKLSVSLRVNMQEIGVELIEWLSIKSNSFWMHNVYEQLLRLKQVSIQPQLHFLLDFLWADNRKCQLMFVFSHHFWWEYFVEPESWTFEAPTGSQCG